MKAFAGFGCSFGGKWFGGYARSKDPAGRSVRGYATQARNVVLEQVRAITSRGCAIERVDFLAVEPAPTGAVLYLDPPYSDTTGYGATGVFDHARFYARVAAWSRYTDVFVSEYAMPTRAAPLLEFSHDMSVAGGVQKNARTERLYHFAPWRPFVADLEAA